MEAKLTLKLDKDIILSAKQYAANNNHSLSKIVENYFRSLSITKTAPQKHSPLVESLIGVVKEEDWKKLVEEDPRARWIIERQ